MSDFDRGRGGGEPPLPKPYDFVPLARRVQVQPPSGHQRYERVSGRLAATLLVHSPVHVASGLLEQRPADRTYPLVKAHFRSNGRVVIPATSLKGCIRSIVEAISPSAVSATRARLPRAVQLSHAKDQFDPAQRLFGTLGYLGQVRFTDAVLRDGRTEIKGVPQLHEAAKEQDNQKRRRGIRVEHIYFEGQQARGRKFYMHGELAKGNVPLEVCPVGSRFAFSVDFENLTRAEVGLLLYGLGLGEPRLVPKLGGAKPACLGTIEVVEPHLVVYDQRAAYSDFDDVPTETTELTPYTATAREEKLVLDAQLKELERILRWPRTDGRECPDRNY